MSPFANDAEYQRWNTIFANADYFYGEEPGPVARRAVRYHRPLCPRGGTAVDFGCGEGQDLAFLAECGYDATGYEFTASGVQKTRDLLEKRNLAAQAHQADLRAHNWAEQYNLVLSINALQFLGEAAPEALGHVIEAVAAGGVLGLSLFAREDETSSAVRNGIYFITLRELMSRVETSSGAWQMLETAQLWQWNRSSNRAQMFVTLVAQRIQ
jgi:SAM-dependent methyltransferase